jgi:predicted nucleic acid-binding protein
VTRFIVDASVAVKWFLPEIHSAEALRLLRSEHTLLAPDLLWAEVGNILWKRWRRGELSSEAAAAILHDLKRLPLQIHPCEENAEVAWEIATSRDRSFYDSLYMALGRHQGCPLVTADSKLFNAVGGAASGLVWVEDIPASD